MSRAEVKTESAHTPFVIETMSEHDLLDVVEIEEASGLSLWGWDAYREELVRAESIMLVARGQGFDAPEVAGFIASRVGAGELHVNNVGVREEYRRRGIGAALLKEAVHLGQLSGAQGAVLEVRAGNHAAQALYRRLGFGVAGRRRQYYRNPTEDALVMSLGFDTTA
ncbi:MAG: ribosomal protein S18-alanine N-acetyltransferase [Pyrinomonadaceae bacterium]